MGANAYMGKLHIFQSTLNVCVCDGFHGTVPPKQTVELTYCSHVLSPPFQAFFRPLKRRLVRFLDVRAVYHDRVCGEKSGLGRLRAVVMISQRIMELRIPIGNLTLGRCRAREQLLFLRKTLSISDAISPIFVPPSPKDANLHRTSIVYHRLRAS